MSKYGLVVMGNIRVFRKEKEIPGKNKKTFTVNDVWFNVSEKDENEGSGYYNKSMNLIFKRGVALPQNNTVINIVSAFPMITGTGNYRKIVLYVEDWEIAGQDKKTDDDLPF